MALSIFKICDSKNASSSVKAFKKFPKKEFKLFNYLSIFI
jgi:hypothetical protein